MHLLHSTAEMPSAQSTYAEVVVNYLHLLVFLLYKLLKMLFVKVRDLAAPALELFGLP